MDAPSLGAVRDALAMWSERMLALSGRTTDNKLEILVDGEPIDFDITPDLESSETYVVSCPWWHGHFESAWEAVRVTVDVLRGQSRLAEEFRGEKLAAVWREEWHDGAYLMCDVALYLNPMDPTEWELWDKEKWRVVRRHCRLLECMECQNPNPDRPAFGACDTVEVENEATLHDVARYWSWLPGHYGEPLPGMRWTLCGSSSFVVQIPNGWRAVEQDSSNSGEQWTRFVPKDEGAKIEVSCWWNPLGDEQVRPSTGPEGILAETTQHVSDQNDDSQVDTWTLHFKNLPDEMMAFVRLTQDLTDDRNLELIRLNISEAVKSARYVLHS